MSADYWHYESGERVAVGHRVVHRIVGARGTVLAVPPMPRERDDEFLVEVQWDPVTEDAPLLHQAYRDAHYSLSQISKEPAYRLVKLGTLDLMAEAAQ